MKREGFEKRLFRVFAEAGYSPSALLTISPEQMVEIPNITVPNIRTVLCIQNNIMQDQKDMRVAKLLDELMMLWEA